MFLTPPRAIVRRSRAEGRKAVLTPKNDRGSDAGPAAGADEADAARPMQSAVASTVGAADHLIPHAPRLGRTPAQSSARRWRPRRFGARR
jgi:hypothetical protein